MRERGRPPAMAADHAPLTMRRRQPLFGAMLAGSLAIYAALAKRRREQQGQGNSGPGGGDRHGRGAAWPSDIPRRGWRDVLMRAKDGVSRTNLSLIAAGVAFYGFLAIPSAFAALVSLYGLVFDPADVGRQLQSAEGVLPGEATTLLSDQLQNLTSHPNATLGVGFIVSLSIALWSARSATSSTITALNIAYEETERRGVVKLQLVALALTLGAVVFAVVALALIAVLPAVIHLLPLGSAGKTVASAVRWPILVIIVMVALAAMYRYAPCRAQARWRWVSWGAVAATALWIIGSALFSLYVGQFASYDKTYGSLGAVVVLLMWLYLSAFVVLFGAELNAEIEHQTARDSTTGRPLPMGRRGARMADTLGEAK